MDGREYALRPYQEECLAALLGALAKKRSALLEMATAGGKTIVFSALIKRLLVAYPGMRILVLAHRHELVRQARDKLHLYWPGCWGKVGIACAAMGKPEMMRPIVIGTVQTVANRLDSLGKVSLLIIDEAHRLAPAQGKKMPQYQEVIRGLRAANPGMRVLGVTATPYRMREGPIYGNQGDLFDCLDHSAGLDMLTKDGWLAPIRAKESDRIDAELESVGKGPDGDYAKGRLGGVMSREEHITSAVRAYEDFGECRRHALCFAVTIPHAERLAQAFSAAGHRAALAHSKMACDRRESGLAAFQAGAARVLVSVGMLTEGWDCPKADLIIMARPTLSPGLFVQMIGRGTRLYPGKTDLLVLDLVGNFARFGSPYAIAGRGRGHGEREAAGAPLKKCPACQELLPVGLRECPICGHVFPAAEKQEAALVKNMRELDLGLGAITEPIKTIAWDIRPYVSRNGNYMARIDIRLDDSKYAGLGTQVSQYLDIAGAASAYGQRKARQFWARYAGTDFPGSVSEAVDRAGELVLPGMVRLEKGDNGMFWVKDWVR